jgi:hypothetical protein
MSSDDGIDVVLTWLSEDAREDQRRAAEELDRAKSIDRQIDELEARGIDMYGEVGIDIEEELARPYLTRSGGPLTPSVGEASSPEWEDQRRRAEQSLKDRGIDPASVGLDDLLDPDEVRRIERRFMPDFTLSVHLDRWDVAMTVMAGLAAALVDFLIVRIPRDVVYLGLYSQKGSPLTELLQDCSVGHDNWLSHWAKVSYDQVNTEVAGIAVAGSGPRTHRLLTFGHDPLLGLVVGTIDIMRGGMTAVDKFGVLQVSAAFGPTEFNPFVALAKQIAHILSDGFTQMGVPAPGLTLLNFAQVGAFGSRDRTVAELARFMYLKGYDSRHFLTMGTSVAALETCLRTYWVVRRELDPTFAAEIDAEAAAAGSRHIGDHPRFQAMAFGAYAIAAAANAGKVAAFHGNPLAINYATWLGFLRATFKFAQGRAVNPTDVLVRASLGNAQALAQGWPNLNTADDDFPRLDA